MHKTNPNRIRFLPVMVGLMVGLVGGGTLSSASAQTAGAKLQSVEQEIKRKEAESQRQKARATALKKDLNALSGELVAAAQRVQRQETLVGELERELKGLKRTAQDKETQLRDRQRQFSGVMMALSSIARFPTEALIAQPISPEDTVRSAILLRAAVPAIERRAATLKLELDGLAQARRAVGVQRQTLQGAAQGLRADEARIETMRKQKAALRAEAISKSRAAKSQARQLAKQAKSLRDLVAKLNAARRTAEKKAAAAKAKAQQKARAKLALKPRQTAPKSTPMDITARAGVGTISKARGKLPFPAVGRLAGLYGQQLDGGLTSKGLSIETRAKAQVIAPFDGKVVFSGPFRGYGQLLIIDHGEGYHSLLAGLGRIDVEIGQAVLAGEPVATMGGDGQQPILYVEFRRDNQPINPLPWLVQRNRTPRG